MEVGLAAVVGLAAEVPVVIGKKIPVISPVIPAWARHFLRPSDLAKIQEAVTNAEKNTTGEIIPMVVRRSSFGGHLPVLLTLILIVVVLVFEVPQLEIFDGLGAHWALILVSALCFGLGHLLSKLSLIQRWLTPKLDQAAQVEARAELEFHRLGITGTAGLTGILLFISLMERRAVVLADQGISAKMSKEAWAEICQLMVQPIGKGKTAEGICRGIHRSGELLTKEFPLHGENSDELSNQLILKE